MTKARERLISLDATPYYHCMGRCVRQAYLCGDNHVTGQNFDHRKQWIVDRLKQLSSIFSIDVCAYAVMSNHYHVVLKVDVGQALAWSLKEVAEHWLMLFSGTPLIHKWLKEEELNAAERDAVSLLVEEWRERLHDISWYMRCLNEYIARLANDEDKCKGRFWEGRFKSQALLDEAAVITCMMYVDLNPVRAKMCETLEESDFTSIQERLIALASPKKRRPAKEQSKTPANTSEYNDAVMQKKPTKTPVYNGDIRSHITPKLLLPFAEGEVQNEPLNSLPFALKDYLELIDWTERAVRTDKPGAIPESIPKIFDRLGLNQKYWLDNVTRFEQRFFDAVGRREKLIQLASTFKLACIKSGAARAEFYQR